MRRLLILNTVLLGLMQLNVYAQIQPRPQDVCLKLSQINSQRSAECAQIISHHYVSPGTVSVAIDLARYSSFDTINALNISVDKEVDIDAAQICRKLIGISTSRSVECLGVLGNAWLDPSVIPLHLKLANMSSATTIKALQLSVNAEFQPSAIPVCERIANISTDRSAECLGVIANKVFWNGAESICLQIANNSSYDAINCLKNSAIDSIDNGPLPIPGGQGPLPELDLMLLLSPLDQKNMVKDLRQAQHILSRGASTQASDLIERVINQLLQLRRGSGSLSVQGSIR